MLSFVFLVFLSLSLVAVHVAASDISTTTYVHSTIGSDVPQCYNRSIDNPCRTLSYALDHLHNATRVVLLRSTVDYPLDNGLVVVDNKHIFALEGESGFVATIRCSNQSGFVFSEIEYLSLVNLHVTGCGTIQSSTSKNYTNGATSTISFLVAVYMNWCAKVNISRLFVTESEGTAVTMYNCGSQNAVVTDSSFTNNIGATSPSYGGGFYVEFTYCGSSVVDCDNKSFFSKNSNNHVIFDNCTFANNQASASDYNAAFIVPHGRDHYAFGRGGGLSFYFKGTAQNNSVVITRCHFLNNTAVWGGGLFTEFHDSAANNTFTVDLSYFVDNTCNYMGNKGTGGGGMHIGHYVFGDSLFVPTGNKVTLESCDFIRNSAMHGGGLSVSPSLVQVQNSLAIPQVVVSNCSFYENTAKLGAALESTVFPLFLDGSNLKLSIVNGSFVKNRVKYVNGNGDNTNHYQLGIGAVYLNGVPALFNSTVNFTENDGSAVAVATSYVDFTNCWKAMFHSNRGNFGGAINLLGNAVIQIGQDTDILFEYNHATLFGGVIHNTYIGYENTVSYTKCFIKHSDNSIPFTNWTSKLSFINNTAGSGGQAIFSSSVLPCAWAGKYGLVSDVSSFFCQWHFETKDGSSCADQIETLANNMSSETNWQTTAYPGEMIHLNINVSDDLGHSMTDTVVFSAHTADSGSNKASVAPPFRYVTDQSLILAGNVTNDSVSLILDTIFSRSWQINYTVIMLECPAGHKLANEPKYEAETCRCAFNNSYFSHLVCKDSPKYSLFLHNGYWVGQPEPGTGPLYMGPCPPHYCKVSDGEGIILPVINPPYLNYDETICSPANRKGILCGECIENFSVSLNTISLNCVNCSNTSLFGLNLTLYLLGNYVPVVVLFLAIIVLNIRLTAGPAVSFLFFCQVVAFGEGIAEERSDLTAQKIVPSVLDLMYKIPFSVLNLRFLFLQLVSRQVCFKNLHGLDVVQLDSLVAVSPLLMIFIVVLLVKLKDRFCSCSHLSVKFRCFLRIRKQRNLKMSLLHAFSAFILLSYNTFWLKSAFIFSREGLFNASGEHYHRYVSYHAGFIFTDTRYYQLRYALPAYIMIVVFVIPPPLVLLVFPVRLFERCIVHRSSRIRKCYPADKVAILLDTFQGCYRDNMRFFAGLYLICRLAIISAGTLTDTTKGEFSIQAIISLVMMVLVAVCQPYRKKYLNIVDTLILADLVTIKVIRIYLSNNRYGEPWVYWLCYILILLPVLYILGYLVCKMIGPQRLKFIKAKFLHCVGQQNAVQQSDNQSLFNVASSRLYADSFSNDEVERLLRRAEERNDYYPSAESGDEIRKT